MIKYSYIINEYSKNEISNILDLNGWKVLEPGTESFYNHNNRPEYDAAEMTNKNYKGDASKVEVMAFF